MSQPICSVLIATRKRPVRLLKTIHSVINTAKLPVEFVLRYDDDDEETAAIIPELEKSLPLKAVRGSRLRGWESCNIFYSEAADVSSGKWVLIINDDAEIQGEGWDVQLSELPTHGLVVYPETYKLNFSKYYHAPAVGFEFVPNQCWKKYGHQIIPHPIDVELDRILVKENGWTNHFLNGITAFHDRDGDEELSKHRL
jgi:hypothetical protein